MPIWELILILWYYTIEISNGYFDKSNCSVTQLPENSEYEQYWQAVYYLPPAMQASLGEILKRLGRFLVLCSQLGENDICVVTWGKVKNPHWAAKKYA